MESPSQAINLPISEPTSTNQIVDADLSADKPPIPYAEYINSAEWSELKNKSSRVWGCACLACGEQNGVDRHHLFYRVRIENASPYEIIPLCRNCHNAAHTGGENKNGQPADKSALDSLVCRLFDKIARIRGFSGFQKREMSRRFRRVFCQHVRSLFSYGPKKVAKIVDSKTAFVKRAKKHRKLTRKEREKRNKKAKKKSKHKHGFFRVDGAESTKKGAIETWSCYQQPSGRRWGRI